MRRFLTLLKPLTNAGPALVVMMPHDTQNEYLFDVLEVRTNCGYSIVRTAVPDVEVELHLEVAD